MESVLVDDMGIPNTLANHSSDEHREICRKLERGWMGAEQCPFCDLVVLEFPLQEHCPFCTCDPRVDVDQDALEELIRF
jgi:hypothetical protein